MSDRQTYGEWLRQRREAAGLSKNRLAGLSGVSTTQISNIESGRTHRPTDETWRKLVAAIQSVPEAVCAFCGDRDSEVSFLIVSPRDDNVAMCDGCLKVCVAYAALQNHKRGEGPREALTARSRMLTRMSRNARTAQGATATRARGSRPPRRHR